MTKTFGKIFVIASGMVMALSILSFIYLGNGEVGFTLFAASFIMGVFASILEDW